MSIESVRAFLVEHAPDTTPIAPERDSETHTLSTASGIKPAQIAKTLLLPIDDFAAALQSKWSFATSKCECTREFKRLGFGDYMRMTSAQSREFSLIVAVIFALSR